MKALSNGTLERLKKHVLGDARMTMSRNGALLIELFTKHGGEAPEGGFLPRLGIYADDQLRRINGTSHLQRLIEEVFDPIYCAGHAAPAVKDFNKFLQRDGYKVRLTRDGAQVQSLDGAEVAVIIPIELRTQPTQFVEEQISKCEAKLRSGDYAGAITNARTLCEEVFWFIDRQFDPAADKAGGNVLTLFGRVRKRLNIDPEMFKERQDVLQVISGLVTLVGGLAAMSNELADRHARAVQPKGHHARLAVNVANTVCTFVVASFVEQWPSLSPCRARR